MKFSNKTVLVTGGGSGIGLDIAKLYAEKGFKVLIIGRNGEKLTKAAAGLKGIHTFACDITKSEDVQRLYEKISNEFGDLSLLINNAAAAHVYQHADGIDAFQKASEEMLTNYLSVIRLNETFLPLLKKQPEAAIVNITSLVSVQPVAVIPTYSDTKAALHSYSLTLRYMLAKNTKVKVFELMPPLVNTEFSKEIGGEQNGIPSITVASSLIDGIEADLEEIYVGHTKDFRDLYFSDPKAAFSVLNP